LLGSLNEDVNTGTGMNFGCGEMMHTGVRLARRRRIRSKKGEER
jgi:hypothetical protein